MASGSSLAGLSIGKSAGDGVVYAKDLSRPMVFTIESALFDELKKPADDFRVKDLFDARSFNTTRVEIVRNGQTITLEKEKDKAAWKQIAPAAKAADTAKVEALLTALSSARATSFVDKVAGTGLETPELTVTIDIRGRREAREGQLRPQGNGRFRPPRRRRRGGEDRRDSPGWDLKATLKY